MKIRERCRLLLVLAPILLASPLEASTRELDPPARQLVSGGPRDAGFALAELGKIAGRVRHRDTREPVDTRVRVYSRDGSDVDVTASQQGAYELDGLPPGEYWVVAYGKAELAGMIYGGATCNPALFGSELVCPTEGAAPVRVQPGQTVAGIDFDLPVGGVLTGRVLDARTGGRPTATGSLVLWDEQGRKVHDDAYIDIEGFFRVEGLAQGTYFASFDSPYYTPQFFDEVDCIEGDSGRIDVAPCLSSAQPIAVSLGAVHGPIEFSLRARGTLSGRIRDDLKGAGVEGAVITVLDSATAAEHSYTASDSAGFFSLSDIPAVGIKVQVSHPLYRPEYFDDVDLRRGPGEAKILEIAPGELTTLEVGLEPRGSIKVRALEDDSGEPLGCFSVRAIPLDLSADTVSSRCDGDDGWRTLEGVAPGDYYVMVEGNYHAAHLYGRGSCTAHQETGRCHLALGMPVRVRSGETLELGTFRLVEKGDINWRVDFAGTSPPPLARLRLFDPLGDEVRTVVADHRNDFGLLAGLAPGAYRLVAEGSPHWQSVAYPDVPCSRWYCNPLLGEPIEVPPGAFGPWAIVGLEPIAPYAGCTPSETALCLNQGRYRVSATWRDFAGATGAGSARGLTADSGYFFFFSPNNLEVLVKVLNGCEQRLGHRFWVYGAGLTNVQVGLTVEDTLTGEISLYSNALGGTFQPILDSDAFATCGALLPAGAAAFGDAAEPPPALEPAPAESEECPGEDAALCLGGRFAVGATYLTAGGEAGSATGSRVTPDTATFTFFDTSNVELVVKVLDACSTALPGYWVFASGLTDVAVELTIEDRAKGRSKIYRQPLGPYAPVIDLASFPCD